VNQWLYNLVGYFVRREACRLAAAAIRQTDVEAGYMPRLWSMTVFFEMYILAGHDGTREDFGPKEPVKLEEAA
jgi:hypothetical protein